MFQIRHHLGSKKAPEEEPNRYPREPYTEPNYSYYVRLGFIVKP